jgi:glycine cleavage system regulatory protein
MPVSLVLTVIGQDRPGLVEAISQSVASHKGSWQESRMARLSGQFAGILLVSVSERRADALSAALTSLETHGLQVAVTRSDAEPDVADARQLRLELIGSDRPGIIRDISEALADRAINFDELRTEVVSAPMSGELLFRASAELRIPWDLELEELRKKLEAIANELMVDIDLDESG